MRHEIWDKIKDEMVIEGCWPEKVPWDTVIAKSVYGSGDQKRMHWWFLHVLAPASRGGKNLVKAVEGTSLIPAPDGLFGNTASATRAPAPQTQENAQKRSRIGRAERRARAAANWWQESGAWNGGSSGDQASSGKGKSQNNKGQGKGKNKSGKKGGKDFGKDQAKGGKTSQK